MPIFPYTEYLPQCIESIEKQSVRSKIIVSEQPVEKYINKNKLLNKGIRQSSTKKVFVCDADFILNDPTLLERLNKKKADIVFPMYMSVHGRLKMSDGGYVTTKKVVRDFGWFDESHLGISKATFVFVDWCIKNIRWFCSPEFQISIQNSKGGGKVHWPTYRKVKPSYLKVANFLKKKGLFPDVSVQRAG